MNKKQKDKGLMKAVKEQPQFRLTSNFTFRTMQKVEEAILLREKTQERKMLLATIAASACIFILEITLRKLCIMHFLLAVMF